MEPERLDELWQRWLQHHAASDREHLIVHYRPLVDRCANGLSWRYRTIDRMDRDDLRSDGYIGLMAAVEAFIPDKHYKGISGFKNYAWSRITGSMIDGVRRSGATLGNGRTANGHQPRRIIRLADDLLQGMDKDLLIEMVDPSDDVSVIDSKVDLVRALKSLSQGDRDLLLAYYWKGETLVTLAKRTGVTDSRVCQKVKLARDRLKRKLVA
jgi:RNA polymerase sigma factor (sigma-70 family)